jgi:SlyX protein
MDGLPDELAKVIETLEIKLAHLERTVLDLNDVVVRQQREIDALRTRSVQLAKQLESAEGGASDPSVVEIPPHY